MTGAVAGGGGIGDEPLLAQAVRRRTGDRVAAAEADVRRLLDVGLALLTENPSEEPKVADIVRRAGVSLDAFYRTFRGKAELMAAIADDGARRVIAYVRHQRDKATDPREQLAACIRAVLRQAADPGVAETTRAVLRGSAQLRGTPADTAVVRDRLAELLVGPLRALGTGDPVRDSAVMARSVVAELEGWVWSGRAPGERDVEHLVGFQLRGAGVAPDRPASAVRSDDGG